MARLALKRKESLSTGIPRLFEEQLGRAVDGFRGNDADLEEAVHRTRATCKELRAALRLVRPAIGPHAYRAANGFYRDAARQLSDLRDAHVQLAILDTVEADLEEAARFPRIRAILEERVRNEEEAVADKSAVISELVEAFDGARANASVLAVPNKFSSIRAGLARTYARGRAGLRACVKDPSLENAHEWRKRVKYLRYQLGILRPLWPAMMKCLQGELKLLSEWLGDARDMALLERLATEDSEYTAAGAEAERLVAELARRRTVLLKQSLPLGRRLYAEPADDFVDRVETWWRTRKGK
ncbi:MAG: hypothetical protein PWP23_3279 [Candidatus Sumerlaeota bacterium]|nr:hypothetical protein [Candidatus Sumerlaeota bacterium]